MDRERSTIAKGENISETGNKIECMGMEYCITLISKLPTKDTGKMTNFGAKEHCIMSNIPS